ncbi:hypothetical protein [Streptomyces sp. NPDC058664]|uniref:hypothetical protein n=1 Tax=unclassified Streptomyces TaxID=2593676 RepID=UPI0036530988
MEHEDEGSGSYEPVMAIVLAKSNGGPFEDAAVVAGMTCGALDQELAVLAALHTLPRERYIDGPLLPQADLLAMKHGYILIQGELDEPSGYRKVAFDWTA